MATTLEYTKSNNPGRLCDELAAAGVRFTLCLSDGKAVRLTVTDDQSTAAVDAVVAAHDPLKLATPTADEVDRLDTAQKLQLAVNNWASLNAAQKDALLLACVRGVLRMVR